MSVSTAFPRGKPLTATLEAKSQAGPRSSDTRTCTSPWGGGGWDLSLPLTRPLGDIWGAGQDTRPDRRLGAGVPQGRGLSVLVHICRGQG